MAGQAKVGLVRTTRDGSNTSTLMQVIGRDDSSTQVRRCETTGVHDSDRRQLEVGTYHAIVRSSTLGAANFSGNTARGSRLGTPRSGGTMAARSGAAHATVRRTAWSISYSRQQRRPRPTTCSPVQGTWLAARHRASCHSVNQRFKTGSERRRGS